MKKILAGSLVASTLLLGSNSIDLNLNNNTIAVGGEFLLNEIYELNNDSNYYVTLNYLNSEDKSPSESLLSAGVKVLNPYISDEGYKFGIGLKIVIADNYNSKDFLAVPLLAFGNYNVNEKVTVDLDIAYAPSVLSFQDAEKFTSLQAKANYKIMENGLVYVGTRSITTKYTNGAKIKYDTSLFLGYKVQF
ncbi:MAG TPA: hypothetical protein EYG97_02245 [Arcobacter sp.]|nr:hypothetical protein [Arcobacter sp.]HIP55822.1 hypothetical protein [Arcobacter sp.]